MSIYISPRLRSLLESALGAPDARDELVNILESAVDNPLTGNLNANGFLINNLENPVNPQDAATMSYVLQEVSSGISPITNVVYVAKNGNDTTGNGSIASPYLTVSMAASVIGSASNSTNYDDPTQRYYQIVVGPGVYTENVTFGTRPYILLRLECASIAGNLNLNFNQDILDSGTLSDQKFILLGADLRSAYNSSVMPLTGIVGNILVQSLGASEGLIHQTHIINCGATGNFTALANAPFDYGTFTAQIFLENAFISGSINIPINWTFSLSGTANATAGATYTNNGQTFTVIDTISSGTLLNTTATGSPASSGTLTLASGTGDSTISFVGTFNPLVTGTLYASNIDTSATFGIGGVSGAVNLNILRNVRFDGAVVTSSGGGRWFNTSFAAVSNNFTGSSSNIVADANSYSSFNNNVSSQGSVTFTLIDQAQGVGYVANPSSNWAGSAPVSVQSALDRLATEVKALNGGTPIP
jgi:hypothetical protein